METTGTERNNGWMTEWESEARRERDRVTRMLDDLLIRLHDRANNSPENCPACPNFQEELDRIIKFIPETMDWWRAHQRTKAEATLQKRNHALNKLTREDAVALGVEDEWDDLAHERHMEE